MAGRSSHLALVLSVCGTLGLILGVLSALIWGSLQGVKRMSPPSLPDQKATSHRITPMPAHVPETDTIQPAEHPGAPKKVAPVSTTPITQTTPLTPSAPSSQPSASIQNPATTQTTLKAPSAPKRPESVTVAPLDLTLPGLDINLPATKEFGTIQTVPAANVPNSPTYPLLDFERLTLDTSPDLNVGYDGKIKEEHAFKVGIENNGVTFQTKLKTTPEGAELQGVEIKIDLP